MASYTISIPGTNEDMNELRRRYTRLGVALGFGAVRGRNVGRGSMLALIRGVGDGEIAMIPRRAEDDFAWLAEVLTREAEAAPERRDFVKDVLTALRFADETGRLPKIGGDEPEGE